MNIKFFKRTLYSISAKRAQVAVVFFAILFLISIFVTVVTQYVPANKDCAKKDPIVTGLNSVNWWFKVIISIDTLGHLLWEILVNKRFDVKAIPILRDFAGCFVGCTACCAYLHPPPAVQNYQPIVDIDQAL